MKKTTKKPAAKTVNSTFIKKGAKYKTSAEALDAITGNTGGKLRLTRADYRIQSNKSAVFFYLAVQDKNKNWATPPRTQQWINIPENGGKYICQLNLIDKTDKKNSYKDKELAIFMRYFPKGSRNEIFEFYGIYKQKDPVPGSRMFIYLRTSEKLNIKDWEII